MSLMAAFLKRTVMELGKDQADSTVYAVLMESDLRVKTEYHSFRRQVWFIQVTTVLFCLTCCSFTLMFQAYTSGCKENDISDSPVIEMQKQAPESSSEESQRFAPFIRLSVDGHGNFSGPGNVAWWLMTDSVDYNKYFTLDSDKESLIVHRDGTYKVSLQIMYRGLPEWRNGETQLRHEIRCYTVGYPKFITMLVYVESVNFKATAWKKTLFSEGVFSLTAGDKLTVWSHNRMLIDIGGQSLLHTLILPVSTTD